MDTVSYAYTLSRSTVSIGDEKNIHVNNGHSITKKKAFNILGTGVVFYIKYYTENDTIPVPCIITAKHVIFDRNSNHVPKTINVRSYYHSPYKLDEYYGVKISLYDSLNRPLWMEHKDSTVDLACIPIYDYVGDSLGTVHMLPYSMLGDLNNVYELDEINVLGFPGIGSMQHGTKPIFRKGIIAWISPIKRNQTPFLIDCEIFPGNSGGPVFVQTGGFQNDGSFRIIRDYQFIGITSMMFNKYNEVVSEKNPIILDSSKSIIYSRESYSLGIVVPSHQVFELLRESTKRLNADKWRGAHSE